MRTDPSVSVVIDNYNYGSFLPDAVESALRQSYQHVEVIVVDDGSIDNSREIIDRYAGRVVAIFKENGGQASAFNAGFEASHGEIVCFLDADDWLAPDAIARAVERFDREDIVKVHWPLREVDRVGDPTGRVVPALPLDEGDLAERTIQEGPLCYSTSPTSGNAWRRSYLEQVHPIAEMGNRHGADAYLSILAPLFGTIARVDEPLGFYRVHDESFFGRSSKKKRAPALFDIHCRLLRGHLETRGMTVDTRVWKKHYYAWEFTFKELARELRGIVPCGETLIFVEDGQLGYDFLRDRSLLPFPGRDGEYYGHPSGSDMAIEELERMRAAGASYLAFAWTAFWWLDYYAEFDIHIRSRYRSLLDNERLVAFQLTEPDAGSNRPNL